MPNEQQIEAMFEAADMTHTNPCDACGRVHDAFENAPHDLIFYRTDTDGVARRYTFHKPTGHQAMKHAEYEASKGAWNIIIKLAH